MHPDTAINIFRRLAVHFGKIGMHVINGNVLCRIHNHIKSLSGMITEIRIRC